uniref:Uncharacterized protein n=1 Tax=Megaselia scalaris TaxID=36166 RepID=T1H408_MEGSC
MKTKDLEEISSKLSSVEVEPKSENKKGGYVRDRDEPVEDIWATLEENINQTAQLAVEKQNQKATQRSSPKISTGCGPSPPREVFTPSSPPPLNIATQ